MLHLVLAAAVAISPARIDAAINSLDGIAAQVQKRSGIPGLAIGVVWDGKIVYAKGFGVRKVGTSERVDANTVFALGSISKSLSATVVAGEVGAGYVQWSTPIAKEIPGFTLSDPWVGSHVTIADMFSHRSGLPDHAGEGLEDLGFDRAQIISRLRFEPLAPFRTTFGYTNYGFTAGAVAAANAEHVSWDDLANDILFKPLGMTSTSYRYSDFISRTNRAWLHVKTAHGYEPSVYNGVEEEAPAGNASSSVNDMAKWMILQLNEGRYNGKQIIAKAPLEEMQTPQMAKGPVFGHMSFNGLGMAITYDELGLMHLSHSGALEQGAATVYDLLPSAHLGIIVLSNGFPHGEPETIASMFYDLVEFGHYQRDWQSYYGGLFDQLTAPLLSKLNGEKVPANPAPARSNDAYVGTYSNDMYGPAIVSADSKGLHLTIGPKHMTFALRHWNGDTFVFRPGGGGFRTLTELTFKPATSDRAEQMTIEWLNDHGNGTFTKQ